MTTAPKNLPKKCLTLEKLQTDAPELQAFKDRENLGSAETSADDTTIQELFADFEPQHVQWNLLKANRRGREEFCPHPTALQGSPLERSVHSIDF